MKNMLRIERARQISVSRQTINAIESGKYVPSTVLALKLAKVFALPVEELFVLEDGD
jgi:putative transcriptional regulator